MSDQTKYTQKLKDAKVLVIGGSSGIGYGVAEAVLEHGGSVIISSSNPSRVNKSVEGLKKSYPSASGKISGRVCNLGDEDKLESNVVQLLEECGKLDHIVHTAGDPLAMMKLQDVTIEKIKKAGMVRFFSVMMLAKHAPKYLTGGPRSSITLTTGAVSERPRPNWVVVNGYATGLQGMCRGFALDLKPIRVNLISPGAVDTELWDSAFTAEQKAEFLKRDAERVPTGVTGRVVDVAEAYIYCMKDQNITGSMISTSSGALLI